MPLNLSKLQQLREDQNKDKPKEAKKTKEATPKAPIETPIEPPVDEYTDVMQTVEIVEEPKVAPEFTPQPTIQTPKTPKPPVFSVPTPKPTMTAPFPSGYTTGPNQPSFFKNLATIMKDVKDNGDNLEDGSYTGVVKEANLRTSQKGNRMVVMTIDITTKRGLPSKGIATKFFMIEHSNQQTVDIALRQLRNMLMTVGIIVDYETDMEMVLNNLTDYWKDKPITFEVKNGFVNVKEFKGQRA